MELKPTISDLQSEDARHVPCRLWGRLTRECAREKSSSRIFGQLVGTEDGYFELSSQRHSERLLHIDRAFDGEAAEENGYSVYEWQIKLS